MRALIQVLFFLSISMIAFARTEVVIPERKVETIVSLRTIADWFSPRYIEESEYEGGSVVLDVGTGINGNEVTNAHIELYSGDYVITEFGSGVSAIRYNAGSEEKFIEIRVNKSVVTSLVIKLYTEGAVDYSFTLPVKSL
ncbi:Uncharacterised protein [BD1-7 clade bacterium]|uniref:Uncharacterized protein n=1 Tax=BD1-7 clade bacterium TaxID=2029982 RepID=A0A5S9QJS1_9GAMM|nr:Uncharacterised protein [BD1-7 clade bacterium]